MILFDAGANLTRRVNGMPICFVGESNNRKRAKVRMLI